jgi:hypothetical protein
MSSSIALRLKELTKEGEGIKNPRTGDVSWILVWEWRRERYTFVCSGGGKVHVCLFRREERMRFGGLVTEDYVKNWRLSMRTLFLSTSRLSSAMYKYLSMKPIIFSCFLMVEYKNASQVINFWIIEYKNMHFIIISKNIKIELLHMSWMFSWFKHS